MECGWLFWHEQPAEAESWSSAEVVDLAKEPGVYTVQGPACVWRPQSTGDVHVRSAVRWLTNSKQLAEALQRISQSLSCSDEPWQRRIVSLRGLPVDSGAYAPRLVEAMLSVVRDHLLDSGELSAVEAVQSGPVCEEPAVPDGEWYAYWDDVNGGYLDPKLVEEARASERDWVAKQQVCVVVPVAECWAETGKLPIPLRWVDTNKGDHLRPNYRSRVVVREIKARKTTAEQLFPEQLFSAMPPLEACMILLSLLASLGRQRYKIGVFDIRRAHFYGTAQRKIYVDLVGEDKLVHGSDKCGLLVKSMYGTQDASKIWQDEYTSLLTANGFRRGRSNGAVSFKPGPASPCASERGAAGTESYAGCRVLVHGDDFMVLGTQTEVDEFEALLKTRYEYKKAANLGFGDEDDKSTVFLNRVINVDTKLGEVRVEPDSRHAESIVSQLALAGAPGAETPAEKRSAEQQLKDAQSAPLSKSQASLFRSLTMKAAYLAQDRADIAEATKGLARSMQSPNEAAWERLRRLGKYLARYPQVTRVFKYQAIRDKVRVFVDTDHAGCAVTGLVVRYGQHCLKHASNLQSTISLSSREPL
eukprot:TRINITY_DN24555_c0_g1_i1.p1 TRINITY_DN24555_c0_g1~~TRINITY_DN24555_c0_g1_i1.p1  ORF type:complete len:587 (+),score=99.23 TRINITY_DN24555_c0_g1_i1:363-2123(+)